MTISPRFLDEIRNRLTLSEMIGRRVTVIRAGREFKACCPFHHEKTPSFTINDDKQFYHCFGCGAHGDVLKFVMDHDNLGFRDAVEMLAAEAGLEVPKEDPNAVAKAKQAKDLHDLMLEAAGWLVQQLSLPKNQPIQNYLAQRGISPQTAKAFQIGFAPDDPQALIQHLTAQGFTLPQMIEAGLAKPAANGRPAYAFFRDRVMFPVTDRRGQVIAFGGRILPESLRARAQNDGFKPPKYINSSDTPLFDKSRCLYGEDKARRAVRDGTPVIVAEGYMDVIACHASGFAGAVAPMGTALTEAQIQSLWSMIPQDNKEPILCFDGDNAGRQAASRACERIMPLLKPNHSVRFAFLPDGQDPDSILNGSGGSAKFKAILDGAIPLVDYLWLSRTAGRTFKTPESRAGVIQSIKADLQKIDHPDVQRHYKAQIDARVSETFFPSRRTIDSKTSLKQKPAPLRPSKPVHSRLYETILLAALINHPEIFDAVEEKAADIIFDTQRMNAIKAHVLQFLAQTPDATAAILLENLCEAGFEKETRDILHQNLYVHAAFAVPVPDSDHKDILAITTQWIEVWQSIRDRLAEKERRTDWKLAVQSLDKERESQLSAFADQVKSG